MKLNILGFFQKTFQTKNKNKMKSFKYDSSTSSSRDFSDSKEVGSSEEIVVEKLRIRKKLKKKTEKNGTAKELKIDLKMFKRDLLPKITAIKTNLQNLCRNFKLRLHPDILFKDIMDCIRENRNLDEEKYFFLKENGNVETIAKFTKELFSDMENRVKYKILRFVKVSKKEYLIPPITGLNKKLHFIGIKSFVVRKKNKIHIQN